MFMMLSSNCCLLLWLLLATLFPYRTKAKENEKKVAIISLVTTSDYVPGALTLAYSLNEVNATGNRILMWVGSEDDPRSDLTEETMGYIMQEALKDDGTVLRLWDATRHLTKDDGTFAECRVSEEHKHQFAQNPSLSALSRFWGTCSKFAAWALTDYDVVVYMDADSLAMRNFDFVVDAMGNTNFAAHPSEICWEKINELIAAGEDLNSKLTGCGFSTAFFVIRPSANVHEYLHRVASSAFIPTGEMGALNQLIQQWQPLPRYTLQGQTDSIRPMASDGIHQDWSQVYVYDFTGSPVSKPWHAYSEAQAIGNPNWHPSFQTLLDPASVTYDRYMIPQKLWNRYYEKVLEAIGQPPSQQTVFDSTTRNSDKQDVKKVAIVSLVTTSTYIPGTMALAESLNAVNASGDRILLWVGPDDDPRSDLTEDMISSLVQQEATSGFRWWDETRQLTKADSSFSECKISLEQQKEIDSDADLEPLKRYWGTCNKFAVWGLTEYDVVVFMDADSIAMRNFDFVFDFLDDDGEHFNFGAHGNGDCSEMLDQMQKDGVDVSSPDAYADCGFYTAFFVTKPSKKLQTFLQESASRNFLAEGELTLLNGAIKRWKPLPRYTLVAQTDTTYPIASNGITIDWSQAYVYDFAGKPNSKPWKTYDESRDRMDSNWNSFFQTSTIPGSKMHDRYTIPQKLWSEFYKSALEKVSSVPSFPGMHSDKRDEL